RAVPSRQLLPPDPRHHPGLHAFALQDVLERQGIDHGGQHAHVVGGHAVHPLLAGHRAAHDVPAPDHQADAGAQLVYRLDLIAQAIDHPEVDPEAALPSHGLPRQLDERAAVLEAGHQASPSWKRTNRRTTTFSPTLPDTALTSCPTVCLSSFTKGCSSSTRSS